MPNESKRTATEPSLLEQAKGVVRRIFPPDPRGRKRDAKRMKDIELPSPAHPSTAGRRAAK